MKVHDSSKQKVVRHSNLNNIFYREEDICYTFNGNSENPYYSTKLGPGKGMNFLLNYRLPRFFGYHTIHKIRMILHQPGTAPDFKNDFQSFLDLQAGKYYIIGVKATNVTINEQFKNMDFEKRKCQLDLETAKYSQTTCMQELEIQKSTQKCNCIPWYMAHLNTTSEVCIEDKALCYEKEIKAVSSTVDECPPECSYVQYSASVLKSDDLGLIELCIGQVSH